ncbi:amidohydrolase family protein [Candidatus Bipolaricaulota bacterium]
MVRAIAALVLLGCLGISAHGTQDPVVAVVRGTLIDGTGGEPVENAVVLIQGQRIVAVGPAEAISVPDDARIVDASGCAVLPGLINAHVHAAFDADQLRAWARAGVTMVRDVGTFGSMNADLARTFVDRDQLNAESGGARLIATGPLVTTIGGYGGHYVSSPDDARDKINRLIDQGADVIKTAIEDNLQGRQWPMLTLEETRAIVETAHSRGIRVAAHVSQAVHVEQALDANVDDVNHMAVDPMPDELIARMVAQGMQWVPTMELWDCVAVKHDAAGWLATALDNLRRFSGAGGQVVLGTDYAGYSCDFDAGMPMTEIRLMEQAGMTPMEILVSATRNGAIACGRGDELGTLEPGKLADLMIVEGDPLDDLSALLRVRTVLISGRIIWNKPD